MNTRKKSMLMLAVGALLIVMAVGYASASTVLSITGTANVNATWNIAITGVDEGTPTGNAENTSTPTFTGTTANFEFSFTNPGDEIKYDVTVTNNGTVDAYLNNAARQGRTSSSTEKTTTGIDGLSMYYTGIKYGEPIKKGESRTISVVFRLDNSEVANAAEPFESKIELLFFFEQSNKYKNYTIRPNDVVVLSDNNKYRVLKDNGDELTVIKESPIDDLSIYDSTYSINGVKNYLNTTYKESLDDDIKENLVGDIEIPNYMDYDNQPKSDSDTKYISGFLYNVVRKCYENQGTSNAGMNCDLGWLVNQDSGDGNGKELIKLDGGNEIHVYPTDVYMTLEDGTLTVTDASLWDENNSITGEKISFEYNNGNPLTSGDIKFYDKTDTPPVDSRLSSTIISYNGKNYLGFYSSIIRPYNPEHLYLYPVMTVKKSAIK